MEDTPLHVAVHLYMLKHLILAGWLTAGRTVRASRPHGVCEEQGPGEIETAE